MGKGTKERKVPFGKVARQHLDTYLRYWRGKPADGDEAVFLTLAGEPIGRNTISELFVRLRRITGITDKRVSAHTCRHWSAANCIKQGMPTAALRDLLGHEDWDMIDLYVQLAEQDMRQLYTRYSPIDALEVHQTPKNSRQRVRAWRAGAEEE